MITQSAKEFSSRYISYQKERHKHPEKYALVSTGLKELDTVLGGGYELGQYVVLGGAQKSGKTTLAVKFMKTAACAGRRFIFFGAEMNNYQLASMVFSNMTGIERSKIRKLGLELHDFTALERIGKDIENWPGYFNYGFSKVKDITQVVDTIEKETGQNIEIVIGDYVQLMEPDRPSGNRVQDLESISRGLKHLTLDRKNPMAVVFNAQLNRESIRNRLVDANAFLGSGSIERDMDLGIIIHDIIDEETRKPKPHLKELVIVGSRETGTGEIQVLYNGATATIEDNILDNIPDAKDYWQY